MSEVTQVRRKIIAGAPEGVDALVLAEKARQNAHGHLHIVSDDMRLSSLMDSLRFFAPDVTVLAFPAWDCVPYDRVSPHADVVARRMDVLLRLAAVGAEAEAGPRLLITTASAILQRVPPLSAFRGMVREIKPGSRLNTDELAMDLGRTGYQRAEQVMEPGEFAIRGGLIDLYPPGHEDPVRIDLFGDEVETLRSFDPVDQRTTGKIASLRLKPMSEVILSKDAIERFRTGYRELFGAVSSADLLYDSVSNGQTFPGFEHWLPLFHAGLDTLFAYLPDSGLSLDHQVEDAIAARLDLVRDYYESRRMADPSSGGAKLGLDEGGAVYHPIPPAKLFLDEAEWSRTLLTLQPIDIRPFEPVDVDDAATDAGGRPGRDFADIRTQPDGNVYEAFKVHATEHRAAGRKVVVAANTEGSRRRLVGLFHDHNLVTAKAIDSYSDLNDGPTSDIAVIVLPLGRGFVTDSLALTTEQDLLGERLARRTRRRKAEAFIADASQLGEGDIVVHLEHGIGRYGGLVTLDVGGAPHDCLKVSYHGDDRLFVPVENIDVLSRFGSEQDNMSLDKLGGVAWQARKAKLKERIREMAEQLIRVAAARELRPAETFTPPEGAYDEFCARFPFSETDDQIRAIADVMEDFAKGRPMDRLICGDVGFGKTEVALRAAFVAALTGVQVAVVVPTTLLARQHFSTFKARFEGFPVKIRQLSRLVTTNEANDVRDGLKSGAIDIVIGTHALLAKSVSFANLGLLVVDEEQHFGVSHKESLKQIKADVHVLTLTATPIPRTLQMALTGVRDLSLIATPPVDRLAVRTFILPFDRVVIREALMRERFRGGQSFYVCPRLADLDAVASQLRKLVPEIKVTIAHGQMAPTALEDVMTAFADGEYDVLLATNIIESGLDLPRVNTIIIHRSDMFGLSQLYQLRGRVGRSKTRAYAYLTVPANKKLTATAEKRLDVMQTLDSLGAGFSLASHDLDIRGAGNLLGDEQSGHIKEVGIELYQQLLEEAVAAAREGGGRDAVEAEDRFSPQITLGAPVLIPETYVRDLGARLALYRRAADLADQPEIDDFAAELEDRFGKVPLEVENLLVVVAIKALCRAANVEKIDAGPKGAVLSLYKNEFPNPGGLIEFISQQAGTVKVRPDHKIVIMRLWDDVDERMTGIKQILGRLAELAKIDPDP
ncbi:MAG: transcription-repair coupling factor [Rhodospirillaceae bacterium]|jgi:transcription-repair coupling factor (superfamily II helicase)|nr:transcription-repair coupling factor [Rhodospirillaceae bacterium]MBT5565195.1 transcription-repair coupling factor [Rhodospirillaceae bacterium]MBT6088032.1 transcription-repair coupling factor [Rhodospirillaceae bacterium]